MGGLEPAPVTGSSLEEFDNEALAQLSEIDGGAMLIRLLKSFSGDIGTTGTELTSLIARRENVKAGRLLHRLIGFGDILGARKFSSEMRAFEILIYAGNIEVLEERLIWMNDIMTATQVKLELLIKDVDQRRSGTDNMKTTTE